jgi:hypothetical protein
MLRCNVCGAMTASGLKSRGTLLPMHLEPQLLRTTKTSSKLVVLPFTTCMRYPSQHHSNVSTRRRKPVGRYLIAYVANQPKRLLTQLYKVAWLASTFLTLLIAVRHDQLHATPRPRRGSTARLTHSIGGRFDASKIELVYDSV